VYTLVYAELYNSMEAALLAREANQEMAPGLEA
jgi:hypothetical protein